MPEILEVTQKVLEIFCPSTPMTDPLGFVGREAECSRLVRALAAPGRHAVLFGERGVGKTSTAKFVMRRFCSTRGYVDVEYTCGSADTHLEISRKILESINKLSVEGIDQKTTEYSTSAAANVAIAKGSAGSKSSARTVFTDVIAEVKLTADRLASLIGSRRLVVLLDEYDRISDYDTKLFFAELIKALSDGSHPCKFVLAGVSNTAVGLIGEHESNIRNLQSITIPKMSNEEVVEIVDKGSRALNLEFSKNLEDSIAYLSQGLPYFTHLLCEELAIHAIANDQRSIDTRDLYRVLSSAADNVSEIIVGPYARAIVDDGVIPDLGPLENLSPDYSKEIRQAVLYGLALCPSEELLEISSIVKKIVAIAKIELPYEYLEADPDMIVVVAIDIERVSGVLDTSGETIVFRNPFIRCYTLLRALYTYPQLPVPGITLDIDIGA